MAATSDLIIRVTANSSQATAAFSALQRQLGTMASQSGSVTRQAASAGGGNLLSMAGSFAAGIGLYNLASQAVSGFGSAVIGTNADLEQANVAFTTLLGSGQAAQSFLQQLTLFAQKTPFRFEELTSASRRMLAFGFSAEEVIPLLTNVGDAAAALGMSGAGVDRITTAFGQMKAKGNVQAEEMMQLAEAGVPAWEMLAKALGVDVATAMQRVEARSVSAGVMVKAFQSYATANWGGMMDKQSRTFNGAMSNVADSSQMAIARGLRPLFDAIRNEAVNLGDVLMGPGVTAAADDLAAILTRTLNAWTEMGSGAQTAIMGIAALMVAGGPLASSIVGIIGLVKKLALSWQAAFAVALVAEAGMFSLFGDKMAQSQKETAQGLRDSAKQLRDGVAGFDIPPGTPVLDLQLADLLESQANDLESRIAQTAGFQGKNISEILVEQLKPAGEAFDAVVGGGAALTMDQLKALAAGAKAGIPKESAPIAQQFAGALGQTATAAKQVQTSTTSAASGLTRLKTSLEDAKTAASATKDQLSAAKDELQRYLSAPLVGETALDAAMGATDARIAGLEAQKAQKQLDRLNRHPARSIDAQIKRAQLERTIMQGSAAQYDQQHAALKRLADDQQELTYTAAQAGILASKGIITPLEAELKQREALVKQLELQVTYQERLAKGLITPAMQAAGTYAEWWTMPGGAAVQSTASAVYGGTTAAIAAQPVATAPAPTTVSVTVNINGPVSSAEDARRMANEAGQIAAGKVLAALATAAGGESNKASKTQPGML